MSQELDFEQVSNQQERASDLRDENAAYIEAHPELTALLSDLLTSCVATKPEDVFMHAHGHFGGEMKGAVGTSTSRTEKEAQSTAAKSVATQYVDSLLGGILR